MDILLPFPIHELPMEATQYQAYSTGILKASEKKGVEDWLMCKSLRVRASKDYFGVYYPGDCPMLFQNLKYQSDDCFKRYYLDMPNAYLAEKKEVMIEIIQDMMKNGFYVHGYYNEYYVPRRLTFQKQDNVHDYLLIGFSEKEKKFALVGYTEKHHIEITEISYEQYINAIAHRIDHYSSSINFYQVSDREFSFDWSCVLQSLEDFIQSTDSSEYQEEGYSYGQKALQKLTNLTDLIQISDRKKLYWLEQNIRSYFEHCYFLAQLLRTIQEKFFFPDAEMVRDFSSWASEKKKWLGIIIKYYVTKDENILHRVVENIQRMVEKEIEAIPKVQKYIQNFLGSKNKSNI